MKLLSVLAAASWAAQAVAMASNRYIIIEHPDPVKREQLQDIVCIPFPAPGRLMADKC